MIGLLALLSLIVLGVGIYGLIRGRVAKLRIQSRKSAGLVVLAGFILLFIAGSIAPKVPPASENESQPLSQPKDTTPTRVEATRPPVGSPDPQQSSPISTMLDWFTGTQAYVECTTTLDGLSCSVERRAGNADVTACWSVEFVCVNGTKSVANTCHPVQSGIGSKSIKFIQWSDFSDSSGCDRPTSSSVSNLVLRHREPISKPASAQKFRINRELGALPDELCTEPSKIPSVKDSECYMFRWAPWLKGLVRKLAGDQYAALEADTGVQSPASYLVEFPNQRRYVVFHGCRAHFCSDYYAFFLVDPTKHEMEIIWVRKGQPPLFLGLSASILRDTRAFGWLDNALLF